MCTPLPPIYRDIRRLLVHTEERVRRFARYHKFTAGIDLRSQAMSMMRDGCSNVSYQFHHQYKR